MTFPQILSFYAKTIQFSIFLSKFEVEKDLRNIYLINYRFEKNIELCHSQDIQHWNVTILQSLRITSRSLNLSSEI